MKRYLLAIAAVCLLAVGQAQATQTNTLSINSSTYTAVIASSDCNYVVVYENASTPTADILVKAPGSNAPAVTRAAGSRIMLQGTYTVGDTVALLKSSAGTITVAVEESNSLTSSNLVLGVVGTGNVTGTFTTGTIPKGTGSHSLGDSVISEDTGIVTVAGDVQVNQGGDGEDTLTMIRATNTTPTGTFLNLLGHGSSPRLFSVDIKGNGYTAGYFDFKETAAPANPGAGIDRAYLNSTTHQFSCLTATGTDCMPSGGGGISIGDAVGSGTAGSVLFVDGAGKLAQDNANLFWDSTTLKAGPQTGFQTTIQQQIGFSEHDFTFQEAAASGRRNALSGLFENSTNLSGILGAGHFVISAEHAATGAETLQGVISSAFNEGAGAVSELRGGNFGAESDGGDVTTRIAAIEAYAANYGGATPEVVGVLSEVDQGSGATTDVNGVHVVFDTGTGVITNARGILVEDVPFGANRWAIKTGLGFNSFGDRLTVTANTAQVQPVTFTGVGLNDGTSGGTFTGLADVNYCAAIDGNGTPDTFSWGTGGSCTNGATTVGITGAAQTLSNGVTITFGATTGHTITDQWTFTAYTPIGIKTNGYAVLGGGAATKLMCFMADGVTVGYATMAAGDISACQH